MRLLLDNCVPKRLGMFIAGHEVKSAVDLGWADFDDGALLDAMAGKFDVLVTVDKSIPHQQFLNHCPVAIVLLRAKSNKLADLVPLVPGLLMALEDLGPGMVREILTPKAE